MKLWHKLNHLLTVINIFIFTFFVGGFVSRKKYGGAYKYEPEKMKVPVAANIALLVGLVILIVVSVR